MTLLALLAPPPESPDASKRKFGAEGVAACTAILDGEKKEGNVSRRIGLILARAIHQIEQKSYDAAIADAGLARTEATTAGLMADPYYARSQGRAFDLIESAALYRLGRPAEARDAALRSAASVKHSFLGLDERARLSRFDQGRFRGGRTVSDVANPYCGHHRPWRGQSAR